MMNCKLNPHLQEYIDLIEQGKYKSCKEQLQLIEYVKNVFVTEELVIDDDRIEKYMSYQKYFPYKLFAWEKFCFILHTCVFKKDGTPRWSDMFILMGRGGGKNGYLSFLCFCLLTETNGIYQYDIDICANSEEQAKTSFDEIYNILETPKWRKKFEKNFRWTKTEIQNKKTGSKIKYRTNNPKGKDGLRSGMVAFDEPHAYENWENINVFTTGLGKKPHPRRIYVSTNGDVREGPLDQLINKSAKILDGEIDDVGFLPFICKINKKEDVHDCSNWEMANPSLPYLPTLLEQMKREYQDYLLDPVINNAFMTKRMNIPEGKKDSEVTSWENIMKTKGDVPNLEGKTCVLGIDYTKTTDFMSAFLLFKDNYKYYGIHHSWFCTNSNDKSRIKIPLEQMVERGLLTMIDDVEINPTVIGEWIKEQKMKYNIEKIAVDNYRYSILSRELREAGFDANDKTVKLVRPSDVMQVVNKISSMFLSNKIIVGDDPLFRWGVNNAKLEPAPNNNFKYGKIEPKSRKTDMFMAFVHAVTIEEELPDTFEVEFMQPLVF